MLYLQTARCWPRGEVRRHRAHTPIYASTVGPLLWAPEPNADSTKLLLRGYPADLQSMRSMKQQSTSPLPSPQFYYEAIDRTLQEIKEKHPGQGVHLVGHSIGGWVGRAWLAEGCSPADRDNVLSLTTLGTPNTAPPDDAEGPWTAVDQTRGLLKSINSRFPGAHVEGVRYTSVAGTALKGEVGG